MWKTHKMMGHFIGDRPAVTIQDFHLAKDLFNKDEWCGRGLSLVSRYLRSDSGINKGIISSDGSLWQGHRRFALKHLKDFGFGKAGLEGVIQGEAEDIVRYLSKMENKDYKMNTDFGKAGLEGVIQGEAE